MKTRNLAVMLTDIQGFTARTSQQTREENALFLRLHDALQLPGFCEAIRDIEEGRRVE